MSHSLHLTTWHPCIDDVSGTFVLEQCRALRDAGERVGLVFSRIQGLRSLTWDRLLRGMPGRYRTDEPIPTFGFKSWNVPGAARMLSRVHRRILAGRFQAYVRVHGRPDILHAHVALEAGTAAREIAKANGLEYVLTEHSTEIMRGDLSPERQAIAEAVYRDARVVITVSKALAKRVRAICPAASIRVIPNLVRDDVFARRGPSAASGKGFRVVSIGALVPHKRTRVAIEALGRLPAALRSQITYSIVGDGPERGALELLASDAGVRTQFHGGLSHDRAMSILAHADLFLHPSALETFGVVLAEAMALGLPSVATRCGAPEEIVEPETGVLVDVDDVESMRSAIEDILGAIDAWRKRSASIADHARGRFHEKVVTAAIADTYRSRPSAATAVRI